GLNTQFWRDRPVAITGATGFLGYHVARLLALSGARVRALVRPTSQIRRCHGLNLEFHLAPLEDFEALCRSLRNQDIVFHLAGSVHLGDDWQSVWHTNVEGTQRLLEAARQAQVRRIVHVSSIVTIGASRQPRVLDESAHWNLASLKVPYIQSKREAETLALLSAARGQDVVIVNPACLVGPQDYSGSEFGVLCRRFWCGRIPLMFRGGANFADVRDVAQGILSAAESGRCGQRYILGGVNRTWLDFFRDLARLSSRPLPRWCAPNSLGPIIATLNRYCERRRRKRPYLSAAQAELLSWFFFVSSRRACEELGYYMRPWQHTLRDTYQFWITSRAA
ncbi:MAG: NAD-dependent epimerase/dehydratase family protein, partial [Gemmatales bacterium]|nr:NAD-dependent epimerase/dehydratase family protein [Gemmatales bacterium]MDW8175104.1 NAD-dependent epimerase/dehydratase family protein [Gemmatales bacterium]